MSQVATHRTPSANAAAYLRFAALMIFLLLLILTLYTFFHEGGHALLGLLFGGTINAFSVNFFNLSAHVGIDGSFSPLQNALISLAGVSLPVLLCMLFLKLSQNNTDPLLGWFKLLLLMGTINSMLAWIVIPLLVLAGQTASDDSFNFLTITRLHPLLVSGAALIIYLACWFFALRWMGGPRAFLSQFRGATLDWQRQSTQKTARILAAVAVFTASLTIALTLALPERGLLPPADYTSAAEIQLSQGRLQDTTLYRFTLDRPALVSLFIGLDQVKGGPVQLGLTGPDGYENILLNFEDPKTDIGKGSVHPQGLPLAKGNYELRGTFPASKGQVRVYIKIDE